MSCDAFSDCHPAVEFVFFTFVIGITSIVTHPLISLISLITGMLYSKSISPNNFSLAALIPIMAFTALINPLFSHEGATILAYFPSGNPLTLESIICGLSSALTLSAVVCWFSAFSRVMTSDKFVWLFGRILPMLGLLLSMTLRFVPRFIADIKAASEADSLLKNKDDSRLGKLRSAVNVFSGCINRALDSSMSTAESMKSRGFGLPGRTSYTNYRLDRRDKILLIWLGLSGMFVLSGYFCGGIYWRSYPTVKFSEFGSFTAAFMLVFALLALTPTLTGISEKYPRSEL